MIQRGAQPALPAMAVFTGDMDLAALDERRRGAATEAFERLLRALEAPVQVIVRIRRLPSPRSPLTTPAATGIVEPPSLNRAMEAHWTEQLARLPAFSREIVLVPWCRTGDRAAAERVTSSIVEGVRRAGAPARVVRGAELRAWIRATFEVSALESPELQWHEGGAQAVIGDTWVRGHQLRRLPGVAVAPGWLAPLLAVRAECDISLRILPATVAEAVSSLGRRLRGLSAQRLLDLDRGGLGDPWNDVAIDSATSLRDGLARNLGRPLRISLCALARGHDQRTLDRASHELRSAFAATLAQSEVTRFRHLDAAITAAPLNCDRLGGYKLVDSRAAATCVPWTGTSFADPSGYRIGIQRMTNSPIRLDLFDSTQHSNANMAILAASGHGKSFAIGTILLEAVAQSRSAIVIDPEEEYRSLIGALGGEYLTLTPGGGSSLNVFELAGTAASGGWSAAGVAEAAQLVVDLVSVLCGARCGEVERAQVDAASQQAMLRARAEGRIPVLGDCVPLLESGAPGIAVVLRRLCSGPLGELFNRPTSLGFEAGLVGISFRDLNPEFVPTATLLVARWLWCVVGWRSRQRHLIFDEVGILAAHPPLRNLLVQLARRCRKYGASLVVATQNAQDLLQSDEGTVIATNCSVLLLGGHRPAEAVRMERAFGLTEGHRRFLETAARGEFLLIAGNRRAEVSIQVPELHRRLLTSPPQPAAGAASVAQIRRATSADTASESNSR